jgi:hypothetical protein
MNGIAVVPFGYDPYEDCLKQFHTDTTEHSGRTFLEHLKGTRDLLKEWDMPEHVQVAGLFHSIYGTNIFQVQSASFDDREFLKAMIGERAERLAYLFCVADRPTAFFEALNTNRIRNRHSQEVISVTSIEMLDLITIEAANHIEQNMGAHLIAKIWSTPSLNAFMSVKALNHCRRFMYEHGITY